HLIPDVPTRAAAIGINASGHAKDPGDVHGAKGHDEADVEEPELPTGEPLGKHAAGDFGIPIEDAGEGAEERAADQHPVEVADDEVAIRELKVDGGHAEDNAREAADQEQRQEAEREEHRRSEADPAAKHGGQPVEEFNAGGNR